MIYQLDTYKISPCKCGNRACLRSMCFGHTTLYVVQCESCKAASRVYYMPESAVKEWNEMTKGKM